MIRSGAILLAVLVSLTPAAAQDRPPERPLEPPGDATPAPAADIAAPEPPEMFGPPPPPAWWMLRETDEDFAACKLALSYLGTVHAEQPPLTDPQDPDCGIARPVRVDRILPDLVLEGGAVMRCDTARGLGLWARDFLRPAAAMLPGAPRVTGLQLGTTYDCRPRIGTGEARPKLSEHALGNAIDIAAILFDGAEPLAIQPRTDTGDLAEAFQRTIRAAGCLFFTTVLGPGANEAHEDHLHLDIAARRGGWRLCQ
ncbi:extensin [Paracoccus sp. YIM 132242]|uniref:Extensin n=1 Tax=Paracoccus lichenicola TaxID=2665644 RepID=A0A6L6HPZ3_9RHOB|nr:extensin family protein [Paracoccus lichenicola]MTE00462.1 extensin [Paracoccus lichenicola]